jgi:hypothetical protein
LSRNTGALEHESATHEFRSGMHGAVIERKHGMSISARRSRSRDRQGTVKGTVKGRSRDGQGTVKGRSRGRSRDGQGTVKGTVKGRSNTHHWSGCAGCAGGWTVRSFGS